MVNKPFSSLPKPFVELQEKVTDLLRAGPAKDVEQHMKAAHSSALARMDVVTREDFDIQAQMLTRAIEKLAALEKRLAELEQGPPKT
jgi:BMFP domain-containing protein YqiC